jgi:hypothetical protein
MGLRSAAEVSVYYADCGVDLQECGTAGVACVLLGDGVVPGQHSAVLISGAGRVVCTLTAPSKASQESGASAVSRTNSHRIVVSQDGGQHPPSARRKWIRR